MTKAYNTAYNARYFFFSSRRRHTRWPRDWSSDVCSSDLPPVLTGVGQHQEEQRDRRYRVEHVHTGQDRRVQDFPPHARQPERKSVVEGKSVEAGECAGQSRKKCMKKKKEE